MISRVRRLCGNVVVLERAVDVVRKGLVDEVVTRDVHAHLQVMPERVEVSRLGERQVEHSPSELGH